MLLCDIDRIVEAMRFRFSQDRFPDCFCQPLFLFLLRKALVSDDLPKVCPVFIAQAGLQVSHGCQSYTVAASAELAVDGAYESDRASEAGDLIIHRRPESVF